jgi:predicted secreted hydrolase
VNRLRRALLLAGLGGPATAQTLLPGPKITTKGAFESAPEFTLNGAARPNAESVYRSQRLQFPRDHGAHLHARTEWWYVTGWIGTPAAPTHGFQVTFFRSLTGLAQGVDSRFAARHLLFAHAAVTSLKTQSHVHDQRMVRWSGAPTAALGAAQIEAGEVHIGRWRLADEKLNEWRDGAGAWATQVQARDFSLDLRLARSQPLLLQGDGGFSRKGPEESQASHYVSEPQLQVQGSLKLGADKLPTTVSSGQAWMDHEWSDHMLHPQAVGWDWIGMNLFDGSALTAFVLRRADGSPLWAGGSFRGRNGLAQVFANEAVRFVPGRRWRSAGSGANYPVQWTVHSPAGSFDVRALLDAQELNGKQSTGSVYWEGLSELRDATGQRVGLGYLEMTGYAAPIKFL